MMTLMIERFSKCKTILIKLKGIHNFIGYVHIVKCLQTIFCGHYVMNRNIGNGKGHRIVKKTLVQDGGQWGPRDSLAVHDTFKVSEPKR